MDPYLHTWDVQDPKAVQFCGIAAFFALIYFQIQFWRIRRRRKLGQGDAAH